MRPVVRPLPTSGESRILFLGHQIEIQRSQRVRMVVSVEWQGQRFEGEASGPDAVRGRLEYTLVAVHALSGRDVTHLAGSSVVEDTADKAIIMAVLQATDRWVRGRI